MSIIIKVLQDPDAMSPRDACNVGLMACWHRRYNLGDVQPKQDPEEWLKENAPKGSIVLPLYLYDHSGISMSTGSFGDVWDSGQVGVIVATPESIRKYTGKKRITAKLRAEVEKWLKQEVKTYDDFLTGNVWGYTIEKTHPCGECGSKVHEEAEEDSCWGFYGDDLDGMKAHVAPELHAQLETAWHNRG